MIVASVEEIIYGRLRQQRSYSTKQMSINVKAVEGRRLIRPTLSFQASGSSPQVTVSAAERSCEEMPRPALSQSLAATAQFMLEMLLRYSPTRLKG